MYWWISCSRISTLSTMQIVGLTVDSRFDIHSIYARRTCIAQNILSFTRYPSLRRSVRQCPLSYALRYCIKKRLELSPKVLLLLANATSSLQQLTQLRNALTDSRGFMSNIFLLTLFQYPQLCLLNWLLRQNITNHWDAAWNRVI